MVGRIHLVCLFGMLFYIRDVEKAAKWRQPGGDNADFKQFGANA